MKVVDLSRVEEVVCVLWQVYRRMGEVAYV